MPFNQINLSNNITDDVQYRLCDGFCPPLAGVRGGAEGGEGYELMSERV